MEYIDIKAIEALEDLSVVLESQEDEFNKLRGRFIKNSIMPLIERKIVKGSTNGEKCEECKYNDNSSAFLVCCNCACFYESKFEPKK